MYVYVNGLKMKEMGFASARRRRLEWIGIYLKATIDNTDRHCVKYDNVLDAYMVQYGLTKTKAADDVMLVMRLNGLVFSEGNIIRAVIEKVKT